MAKVGRKEKLSEADARKICRMIERMPDSQIPVNWDKISYHAKKRFQLSVTRQDSQKEWNGRKLIAEAFRQAKEVQKRMQRDSAPKYQTAARAVLQRRIADLEAMNLALQEELERERAHKIDQLDAFLNTRCDLTKLLEHVGKSTI